MTDTSAGVVSFEKARHIVEEHAAQLRARDTEIVPLLDAAGRVLAEEIRADRDLPPFNRAIRDGYAVRSQDLAQIPASLRIVGEIRAGQSPDSVPKIAAGQAAEIMTGAPLPPGADAVVMIEYTDPQGSEVIIDRTADPGENYVPGGAEARAGDVLLAAGYRVRREAIAVAASVGRAELRVFTKPRVAVLATGDEIVEISAQPGPNQIRNSNTYSLAAQVRAAGAEPLLLPRSPDEPQRLRELLREGLGSDLLLITGGVSMGKYDLVEQVLADLGAEFFFTGARIQPGKPVVFGRAPVEQSAALAPGLGPGEGGTEVETKALPCTGGHTYFLGLPGNPVSTMVTFDLFARPLIDGLAGAAPQELRFLRARLKSEVRTRTGLTRFLPASLTGQFDDCTVEFVPWKGSGDIAAQARSNCLLVVPPDRDCLAAGEFVTVLVQL